MAATADVTLEQTESTGNTNVFHIYHTGSDKEHPNCYSLHMTPDSQTIILSKSETLPPINKQSPEGTPTGENGNEDTAFQPIEGKKRKCYLDNPEYDPRSETAPYFVHRPCLVGHSPPYTLRSGGHKHAPVICLLHQSWGWRGWRLEFGDDLFTREGVVDGRGVISARYGTKKGQDGTLKGYEVRKKRYWGESGKKWWLEQKELGFPDVVVAEREEEEGSEGLKPEEVVKLSWVSPFTNRTRDHFFEWRGFQFIWKGTSKPRSKKGAKPFVWCNHLKLMVLVPSSSIDNGKDPGKIELLLAQYTCVIGQRKAGRLEVYQQVLDSFLSEYVFRDGSDTEQVTSAEQSALVLEHKAKTQKRIKDVVVATAICMVESEREKRRFFLEILSVVGEVAGE